MYSIQRIFFLAVAIVSCLFFSQCKDKTQSRRVIADSDTTYSSDIRSISTKINATPDVAELYYKRSNAFFFENNFKEARTDIDYAIGLDSVNPLYYYKKGEYIMAGDTADSKAAMTAYAQSIRLKPDYSEAIIKLGVLQLARQQYKEAELTFRKLVEQNGSDPDGYFYMGLSAKEQQDTAKAVQLFEKAVQFDGNYYNGYMQLGNYYAEKKNDLALKYFDNAIRINENSDEAYYAKGLYLQNKNLYKDAMALYERTIFLNPGHRLALYNSAYINTYFEKYDKALDLIERTLDLDPDYADAYAMKGFILTKLKRNAEAQEAYNECLKRDPNNTIAKAATAK